MQEKFYICRHCGNLIGKINDSGVPVVCCGQKMEALIPNTVEASGEKHLPFVTLHISDEKRSIFLGEPVMFEEGVPFKQQQMTVVQKLHDVMNELIEKHGN